MDNDDSDDDADAAAYDDDMMIMMLMLLMLTPILGCTQTVAVDGEAIVLVDQLQPRTADSEA